MPPARPRSTADLYYLKDKREQLLNMERMADKSVDNLLEAIETSKDRPLARLIFALGIRHIGDATAEILSREFNSLDELADASRERLMEVPTIGPKIADSVTTFFRQEENKRIINKLREAGVKLAQEAAKKPEELPLAGQHFVITGTLEAFTRQQAEARVKALGGTTGSSVTRKTAYLVVGANPGSKLAEAQALDTRQLTEEEFLRLLGDKT